MWTRPTLPPSRVRNAPYGVILETVPSTTAPTSRSASFSSSESSVPEQARLGHYPIASFPTSTAVGGGCPVRVFPARAVPLGRGLAGGCAGGVVCRGGALGCRGGALGCRGGALGRRGPWRYR